MQKTKGELNLNDCPEKNIFGIFLYQYVQI